MLEVMVIGNAVRVWLLAAGVVAVVYLGLLVARRLVLRNLRTLASRTRAWADDAVIDVLTHTRYLFLITMAVFAGSRVLVLPAVVARGLQIVAVVVLALQVALWGNALIGALAGRHLAETSAEDGETVLTPRLLAFAARLVLWTALLLVSLDNLGVDVTALVAGLGVGGIAVALAVQTILGDIFASLSILLDRPFVAGDFIIVGDQMGTVERVGVKTTRLRALSGEQLVFPNADLIGSRIRNFKQMYERRVVFTLGVVYQTPLEHLQGIPAIIREVIDAQPAVRFDRSHFKGYGPSALDFETVFYVLDSDYNVYMDIQQAINLEIFARFAARGIEFAYPTQTVQLQWVSAA